MSKGQPPFDTNYSANSISLVNVGSEETENANELITFIKGTAGNGKKLFVDTRLYYNPFTQTFTIVNLGQVNITGLGTIAISGDNSFFAIFDRSTGDFFKQFSDGGSFTIQANSIQSVFEITTSGVGSLKGTGAGLRFYERLASPTNYFQFFTSSTGSVFTLTYNTTSIATITTAGITTLVPTKIQTTAQTNGTFRFLTMVDTFGTVSSGQVLSVAGGISFSVDTSTLSVQNVNATTLTGALTGSASRVGNTLQTTGTQFLTMVPLSASTASQVLGTHGSLSYNVATATLASTNFTGALSGSATRVGNTLQTVGTQFLTMVPLSASTASQVVGTHAGLGYNVATGTLFSTEFSGVNVEISDNLHIYDTVNTTHYWEIDSVSDELYFNNLWSSFAVPLSLNGNGGGVSTYNQRLFAYSTAQNIEMDSVLSLIGDTNIVLGAHGTTTNDYAEYITITDPTSVASGALITFPLQAVNLNNRLLEISLPFNVSGTLDGTISGTNRITVNITAITITATRNGGSFTDFAYQKPTLPLSFDYTFLTTANRLFTQPFFQLQIFLNPLNRTTVAGVAREDEYIFTVLATLTDTVVSGGGDFIPAYGSAGFTLNLNTARTGTGITFNTADPTVTLLSATKSGSATRPILAPYYLKSEYINQVYERTITSSSTGFEPASFTAGDFTDFEIRLYISTAPSSEATFLFGFATDTGTIITTNYAGRTAELGSTYATFAWTVGAMITRIKPVANMVYTWRVSNPNLARRKTIVGNNVGYASALDTNVSYACAGEYTSSVAYNSFRWTASSINITGTIYVYGLRTN